MPAPTTTEVPWWRGGVVYQVYPRSFADSNGDGVGDLVGAASRLGHLRDLGVDAVWFSPFYRSPMADFGYDIDDHCDVDPLFGDLGAADRLIETAHRSGLRVVLDFVPGHTSDRHPWFGESRSSRGNPRRDWYVWRDPAPDGGPPTDWRAAFGDYPAWTLDPTTGQYYLHLFLPEQPDLEAMDRLRAHLARGGRSELLRRCRLLHNARLRILRHRERLLAYRSSQGKTGRPFDFSHSAL